jgi:hypothetical protein
MFGMKIMSLSPPFQSLDILVAHYFVAKLMLLAGDKISLNLWPYLSSFLTYFPYLENVKGGVCDEPPVPLYIRLYLSLYQSLAFNLSVYLI